MSIHLINTDILTFKSDALVLTIDGTAPGMQGRIAREFQQRWPETWGNIEKSLHFPMKQDLPVFINITNHEYWKKVILLPVLNHTQLLSVDEQRTRIRHIFIRTIRQAIQQNISGMAAPVLKGGWRLSADQALLSMLDAYEACLPRSKTLKLNICINDNSIYQSLLGICTSMGWEV